MNNHLKTAKRAEEIYSETHLSYAAAFEQAKKENSERNEKLERISNFKRTIKNFIY